VILPKNNKKDLEDIPPSVMNDLTFHFVEHMDEVLRFALKKPVRQMGLIPVHLTA